MSEALYLEDCYLKEFEAEVKSVTQGKFVVLEKTAFYPKSGGQPNDIGIIIRQSDKKQFMIVYVGKFNGECILHHTFFLVFFIKKQEH